MIKMRDKKNELTQANQQNIRIFIIIYNIYDNI